MPTLKEINGSPPKAAILTPKDCKKPSASKEENPFLSSEESNDRFNGNKKMSSGRTNSTTKKPKGDKKGKSRKRSGRQISIFESIGAAPPTGTVLTPSTGNSSNAASGNSAKKKRKRTMTPSYDAFPISVHITTSMEGKEPKKVMITCHGVMSEFSDEFVDPIVLKEKHALPKDPVRRFLSGFGRYIH
eukprot:scaffold560_cov139-Skeletonema_menzelii.AAC.7